MVVGMKKTDKLTNRQRMALRYILNFKKTYGKFPKNMEVSRSMGRNFNATGQHYLDFLRKNGYLDEEQPRDVFVEPKQKKPWYLRLFCK